MRYKFSLFDAASNFSDFFFRFHFQGLKSLPKACSLDFLCWGGEPVPPRVWPPPRTPFAFFPATTNNVKCETWYQYFRLRCERPEVEFFAQDKPAPRSPIEPRLEGNIQTISKGGKVFWCYNSQYMRNGCVWTGRHGGRPRPGIPTVLKFAAVIKLHQLWYSPPAVLAGLELFGVFIGTIRHRQSEGSK